MENGLLNLHDTRCNIHNMYKWICANVECEWLWIRRSLRSWHHKCNIYLFRLFSLSVFFFHSQNMAQICWYEWFAMYGVRYDECIFCIIIFQKQFLKRLRWKRHQIINNELKVAKCMLATSVHSIDEKSVSTTHIHNRACSMQIVYTETDFYER